MSTPVLKNPVSGYPVVADLLGDGSYITGCSGIALFIWNGTSWEALRATNVQKDQNAVAIGSIATVWTPASGKKVRLTGGSISVSGAGSVLFEDHSSGNGTAFRTPQLSANTPYNFVVNGGQGYLLSAANNVLKATCTASANLTGTLFGCEE